MIIRPRAASAAARARPRRVLFTRDGCPAGAVRVDRATIWGNPFRNDRPSPEMFAAGEYDPVEAFRRWLALDPAFAQVETARRDAILTSLGVLHGKDLACWCSPGSPCHGDILLELAAEATPSLGDALGRPAGVPKIAIAVRQPWAWAIVHAGKDIENRSAHAAGGMRAHVGKRIAIHAAKGMTQYEFESARITMATIGVECPLPVELARGGIIGTAEVVDIVADHDSPWFSGPRGLVLRQPRPTPFIGAAGALGLFEWAPNLSQPDEPARWMVRRSGRLSQSPPAEPLQPAEGEPAQRNLF